MNLLFGLSQGKERGETVECTLNREATAFLLRAPSLPVMIIWRARVTARNQRNHFTKVAKEKAIPIWFTFLDDDGISGVTMNRPGFA